MSARTRGQIWLSAVSYVLITVVIIVLLLNTGLPMLEKLKDKSIYSRTKDTFLNLNEQIKDIQAEGPGAQRVIPLEILKGEFEVADNEIKWSMDSKAKIVEPRSKIFVGDLIIGDDSFITFADTIKFIDEDFNTFSSTTWQESGTCSVSTVNGALVYTDAACASLESTYSRKNITTEQGTSLEFTYHGGSSTTIPTDEFYVGFNNPQVSNPVGSGALIGGIVFNGTTGNIETLEFDGSTLNSRTCTSYASSTKYYGKITLNASLVPHYFISTDGATWTQCYNENSTKPSQMRAQILAVSGSATIDDVVVHDNKFHVNNSYVSLKVNKFAGTKESPQFMNTSQLIYNMYSILTNTTVVGNFTFRINDDPSSEQGTGYVELSELRTDPDAAVMITHVNAGSYEYDLIMTMEGGTDFVQVNVQNLVIS